MNTDLSCLRDPDCGETLSRAGDLLTSLSGRQHQIVKNIPRFVPSDNYSKDFGSQWNMFPRTQLDSSTGLGISEARLARCLNGHLEHLRGKKVLEAGCGAGRFTEVLLKYGAIVHSFDYSNAVEASAENNGEHDNLVIVQADIRKIPFQKQSYDYVICLGVLQHTPNPEQSISRLWEMVSPNGGNLVIDHYPFKWRVVLPPPFGGSEVIYRHLTLLLPRRLRFRFVKAITDFFFPLHWRLKDSLLCQRMLRRVSPVHFYYPDLKLRDRAMHYEWSLLDTHDATTDVFKHRRTPAQIHRHLTSLGAKNIEIKVGGGDGGVGIEAFCTKVGT